MGRTRQYATATERQAAYRQRMKATTVWVNRGPFEQLSGTMTALHSATRRALNQGDPLARELYRAKPEDTLDAAVTWIIKLLQQNTEAHQ